MASSSSSQQLPTLPAVTRLSPRVIRILGDNPGKFTLQGTNTYLIGTGRRRILLDTGEGRPAWRESLRQVLRDEGASVERVILTHWHPDHVGGVQDVLELHASSSASAEGGQTSKPPPPPTIHKHSPSSGQLPISPDEVFTTEGASLRALHAPGHTADHVCLVLREEDAMFTGDNVLGHGTAVFEDLGAYLASLGRMRGEFSGRAYPGHGEVVADGPAKVAEYVAHREAREREVLGVMADGERDGAGDAAGWESMQIVKVVYKGYPENLHGPAEGGVRLVLEKLEGEGRVKRGEGGRWSLVGKPAL